MQNIKNKSYSTYTNDHIQNKNDIHNNTSNGNNKDETDTTNVNNDDKNANDDEGLFLHCDIF